MAEEIWAHNDVNPPPLEQASVSEPNDDVTGTLPEPVLDASDVTAPVSAQSPKLPAPILPLPADTDLDALD